MTSMYGAGTPSVKVDSAQTALNGQDSRIKPDPDSLGASPGPQLEDDVYEDAGDLEFNGAERGLYLTKFPKFLWENWSKLDDNQEIQIGTIRVEGSLDDIKRVFPPSCHHPFFFLWFIAHVPTSLTTDESHVNARSC